MEKKCMDCGSLFSGRSDKKFCSDACRINFHNTRRKLQENYIRLINSVLKKNRNVLQNFYLAGEIKVPLQNLKILGFIAEFHTHTKIIHDQNYRFCYEYGYYEDKEGWIQISRDDDLCNSPGQNNYNSINQD